MAWLGLLISPAHTPLSMVARRSIGSFDGVYSAAGAPPDNPAFFAGCCDGFSALFLSCGDSVLNHFSATNAIGAGCHLMRLVERSNLSGLGGRAMSGLAARKRGDRRPQIPQQCGVRRFVSRTLRPDGPAPPVVLPAPTVPVGPMSRRRADIGYQSRIAV